VSNGACSYFKLLFLDFASIQAGPILSHIAWVLVLSGCYLIIRHRNNNAERTAFSQHSCSCQESALSSGVTNIIRLPKRQLATKAICWIKKMILEKTEVSFTMENVLYLY